MTLEFSDQPQFTDQNTYETGFVDYGNQTVDFSTHSEPPPLPEKNKKKEKKEKKNADSSSSSSEEEEGIETTLDEPVWKTLWRELKAIILKLFHVVAFCKKADRVINDWDLWGPMIVCYVFALLLSITSSTNGYSAEDDHSSYVFSIVFICFWVGSIVISLNTKFLGGNLSIPQSVCVVGYCVFPIFLGACITTICAAFMPVLTIWVGIPLMVCCDVWSCMASFGFLRSAIELKRRPLADYPIILFFSLFSWLTIVVNSIKNTEPTE